MTNNNTAPQHFELEIRSSAATNTGLKREINEDSLIAQHPIFLVADGMGGHEAGELASQAVISVFADLVGRNDLQSDEVLARSQTVHSVVSSSTRSENSGSTLAGVFMVTEAQKQQWLVLNLGDSRVYRFAGNHLFQITKDHSLVQDLIDSGQLSEIESQSFEGRNVITKAYGDGESIADSFLISVLPNERLLVCSDGLTGELSDAEISTILSTQHDTAEACVELVEAALDAGGKDNLSVIIVDCVLVDANGNLVETR